ncbi:MAG: hypothetical protein HZB24_15250 [Desulfobacterales bacterium]|nr:hypothetical protein [Desulfobacterales bacterium]
MGRILRWAWCWFFICIAAQTSWTLTAMAAEAVPPQADALAPATPGTRTIYQSISNHVKGAVTLGLGLRFDEMDWNIAGNAAGTNPNILSELSWSDLESQQLSLGAKAQVGRHFYGRGHVNYAWIESGRVRDSDYDGDNRTQEWSRSISKTNDDELWDVVLGGGYPFTFNQRRWLLSPMLGGSIHKQNLRITDGEQVISTRPPPEIGPLNSELNSLYEAFWMSVWSGIDVRYQLPAKPDEAPPMEWGLSLAYHFWGDYAAEANWNLREDLRHPVSFRHEADSSGISLQAEWLIRATRYLNVNLNWNYCQWETDPGTATFYGSEGGEQVQRLNEVNWDCQSFMLGLALRFY